MDCPFKRRTFFAASLSKIGNSCKSDSAPACIGLEVCQL